MSCLIVLAHRQASFHVFGMELLATLDLAATNDFFNTFFRLPDFYWRGFLASQLPAGQLIAFALVVFTLAPFSIKFKLIEHLVTGERQGVGTHMAGAAVRQYSSQVVLYITLYYIISYI